MEACLGNGMDLLLVLDAQGRQQLAATHPADLVSVFPASAGPGRIRRHAAGPWPGRQAAIARRLEAAREEIGSCERYGYVLVSDNLDITLDALDFHPPGRAAAPPERPRLPLL